VFATLAGAYPRKPTFGQPFPLQEARAGLERGEIDAAALRAVQDDLVREVIAEQEAAGLAILSDGEVRWEDPVSAIAAGLEGFELGEVERYFQTQTYYRRPRATREPRWDGAITLADWQFAASATELPVKQSIVGPYTLARLSDPGPLSRERLTMALADALAHELRTLVAAGCPMIQIREDAAALLGDSTSEQRLFKAAQRRLTNDVRQAHLSLAVTLGSVAGVPGEVFFDAPYRSYLLDLVAAPGNWRFVVLAPSDRGIVCGVVDAQHSTPDDDTFLRWAGTFAAARPGRGIDRVGLATSSSLEALTREQARAKIERLGAITTTLQAELAESTVALDPAALELEGVERGYLGAAKAQILGHRPLPTGRPPPRRIDLKSLGDGASISSPLTAPRAGHQARPFPSSSAAVSPARPGQGGLRT
jgi:methionine synthase II (cobalamin-independent)